MRTLIIFAKYPEPGFVKTRLGAVIGMPRAADLYKSMLLDALDQYQSVKNCRKVIYWAPDPDKSHLLNEYHPYSEEMHFQSGRDLGERMQDALERETAKGPAIIVGTDHPDLPTTFIETAFSALEQKKDGVVLGPSADGGYYLIGMNRLHAAAFQNMTYSHQHVFRDTTDHLSADGILWVELKPWYDVDEPEDLNRLLNGLESLPLRTKRWIHQHEQEIRGEMAWL